MDTSLVQADPSAAPVLRMPDFSHAYQPIVDLVSRRVHAYEALVRGPAGEPAGQVLQQVPPELAYCFDEASRAAAIGRAVALGLESRLHLNCLPMGLSRVERPLADTLAAAERCGLPLRRLVLEVTEGEAITEPLRWAEHLDECRAMGLEVAIDDFGAGYAGLNLLADFQPDQVKIDMGLVRGIDRHGPRQAIVRAVMQACDDLAIDVVVEGVETVDECRWFLDHGVRLFQGYLFARPMFQGLPDWQWPQPVGR